MINGTLLFEDTKLNVKLVNITIIFMPRVVFIILEKCVIFSGIVF